jgi:uncharacterized membrane protein
MLAIGSFVWLAYAFHDLARTIQVDQALTGLAASLREAIGALRQSGAHTDHFEHPHTGKSMPVRTAKSGYVQSVNKAALLRCAREYSVSITMHVKPGELVLEGEPIADVRVFRDSAGPDERLERAVRKAVMLGGLRSDLDDPFFCLRLINEIAVRALSPGINDLYTAVACIDHLAEGIRHLLKVGLPGSVLCDGKGAPVVWLAPYELDDFLDGAFDEIRRAAAPHPSLMARLIDRLARLVMLTGDPAIKEALTIRMRNIAEQASLEDYSPADRRFLKETLRAASGESSARPLKQET